MKSVAEARLPQQDDTPFSAVTSTPNSAAVRNRKKIPRKITIMTKYK